MNWSENRRGLVIAHRGFALHHVENSLEAVEAALKLGCDGVEVDLRMTADGELVIFHDPTLKRLAGQEEKVEEMTISGIRKVVLSGKARLPTLEELLDLVRDQALLNIEIKTVRYFSSVVEKQLVKILRSFHLEGSILVSCFHPLPLTRLKKIDPNLKRGYLIYDRYFRTRYRPRAEKKIDPFSLNPAAEMVDQKLVRAARDHRRRIFVWTVNDEGVMKKMIDLGVDGIFTDRPDLFHARFRGN